MADGLSGLEQAQRWQPDLIVLDVMLPGLNGTEVLAKIRRSSDVPVIMVTAIGDTPDRIGALPAVGRTVITWLSLIILVKSFARVQAVLRRSGGSRDPQEEVLRWQGMEVNTGAMTSPLWLTVKAG